MFDDLNKILSLLTGSIKWLKNLNDEKRDAFAVICDKISTILETYANITDDERKSRNLCGELEVYALQIKSIARGVLDENQLNKVADNLGNACELWRKNSKRIADGLPNDNVTLSEIEYTAGQFRGLATYVRTM